MHHHIPFFLALRLSIRQFKMHLERLRFVKLLATFGIINPTDSLVQNITTIPVVCSSLLSFTSETKSVTPIFFLHLKQVIH